MAERIPQQLIQDIIAANDIVSLVGQYVSLKRSGSSYVGLCPFHSEKTPSFHVTPDRQLYYCFGCNAGGDIVEFVKNIEHLDYVEAIRFLAQRAGIQMETLTFSEQDKKRYEEKQLYLEINKEAARFFRDRLFSDTATEARTYVAKRKLQTDTIKIYGIGYAPDTWDALTSHLLQKGYPREKLVQAGVASFTKTGKCIDRFRHRLMFPIIDVRGNVIGFGGRILGEGNVKYLNSPETPIFNKGQNLFSLQLAKRSRELILVEGYMDVISLYQNGIKNAVASLGTALTPDQARLAARFADKVTVCYDTDAAGVKAAMRAIEVFRGIDVKLRILSLPEGKDPDEFVKANGAVKFTELLNHAETPAGFQISKLRKQYNLDDATQKAEYTEACAKVISSVESSVEQEILREKLANETGIRSETIAYEVDKKRRKEQRAERWHVRPKPERGVKFPKNRTAEKLISLCAFDTRLCDKYGAIIMSLLDNEIQRKVMEMLMEKKDASVIVSLFTDEDAKTAAASLSMPVNYENNDAAMTELIAALKKEIYNAKVKAALESGDLTSLNNLLMNKETMQKGGQ